MFNYFFIKLNISPILSHHVIIPVNLLCICSGTEGDDGRDMSPKGTKDRDRDRDKGDYTDGQQSIPRFEKVMRRMDGDGDGKLSPQEFKVALKRLHFKDEKKWTLKMIKRLFDDIDTDKDGLLSVTEFSSMIQDFESPRHTEIIVKEDNHHHLSDEEEEEDAVFTRQRVVSDTDLLRKVLSCIFLHEACHFFITCF